MFGVGHDDYDGVGALMRNWLLQNPGFGALTHKALGRLRTMKNSGYEELGYVLDFMKWLTPACDPKLKYHTKVSHLSLSISLSISSSLFCFSFSLYILINSRTLWVVLCVTLVFCFLFFLPHCFSFLSFSLFVILFMCFVNYMYNNNRHSRSK